MDPNINADESLLGPGEVVPSELRPQKASIHYADPKLTSLHTTAQSFLPLAGKGGEELSGPYEPVETWPQPIEEGWRISAAAAIHAESADRIFVVAHYGMVPERTTSLVWGHSTFAMENSPYATWRVEKDKLALTRPENFVVIYDREGRPLESWTWNDHLFGKLNRIFVDPNDPDEHVWLTDSHKQKVFKFTHDGRELVMEIGEVDAGSTQEHPFKGEDIAWLPNGDFYTAGLDRIDRFTKDGKHIFSRARHGSAPGEFADVHGIAIDPERHRIYVADRGNSRIQIFDEDWNLLDLWPNILAPSAMRLSKDGFVWVGDLHTQKFLKYDLEGHLLCSWGQFGIAPGCTWGIHHFDTDEEGNLYIAENYGDRVQKYRPRDDVEPDDPRLIGPLIRY